MGQNEAQVRQIIFRRFHIGKIGPRQNFSRGSSENSKVLQRFRNLPKNAGQGISNSVASPFLIYVVGIRKSNF